MYVDTALSVRVTCFFFQAEDGIRDYKVTGVQTCALPIYRMRRESALPFAHWFDLMQTNAGAAHAFLTTYLAQNERERIDSLPDLQAACAALQQANAGHPLLPAALGTLRAEIARLELARVRL